MPLNTWAPRRALTHGRTHLLTGRTYETRPALASPRRAVFSRIRASAKPGEVRGEAVRGNRSGQETGEVLGECAPVLAPVVVVPADEDRPGVRMAPSRAPVERVAVARVAPGDQPARFRIRHMAVGHSRVPQVRQFPERLPDTPSEIALLARFRNVQRQEVVEDEGRVRLGQFDEIGRQCGTPLRRHVRPVDATSPWTRWSRRGGSACSSRSSLSTSPGFRDVLREDPTACGPLGAGQCRRARSWDRNVPSACPHRIRRRRYPRARFQPRRIRPR